MNYYISTAIKVAQLGKRVIIYNNMSILQNSIQY